MTKKMHLYLLHGHGSDPRVFSKLVFPSHLIPVALDLPMPDEGMTLPEYALKVAEMMDTHRPFALLGVSFGGMIATEITANFNPVKTVIVSSAKTRTEVPRKLTMLQKIPIHQWVPAPWYKYGSYVAQPLVEPDRRHEKETFVSMLRNSDPDQLKRIANMIINWERKTVPEGIVHIHGSRDHTLPARLVEADHLIKGGSHMMLLTEAERLNPLIWDLLAETHPGAGNF